MNAEGGDKGFVFVVGRGRSGTEMLADRLNQHPDIHVTPEAMFVMNLASRFAQLGHWGDSDVEAFARELWLEGRMRAWSLDAAEVRRTLLDATKDQPADFARLCMLVYELQANISGKASVKVLGDKNPTYSILTGKLVQLFPRAVFIHIVRDYRSNVASFRGVPFDMHSVGGLSARWAQYNESIEHTKRRWPNRFLTVRFEDLLESPEPELRRLCDFLDLPFAEPMLEFGIDRKRDAEWHQNVGKAFIQGKTDEWKAKLTPAEIQSCEAVCGALGEPYGYHISAPAVSRLAMGDRFGVFAGKGFTALERVLFRLPVRVRSRILASYRSWQGTR